MMTEFNGFIHNFKSTYLNEWTWTYYDNFWVVATEKGKKKGKGLWWNSEIIYLLLCCWILWKSNINGSYMIGLNWIQDGGENVFFLITKF
jgi:hypothetical protein